MGGVQPRDYPPGRKVAANQIQGCSAAILPGHCRPWRCRRLGVMVGDLYRPPPRRHLAGISSETPMTAGLFWLHMILVFGWLFCPPAPPPLKESF